MKSEPKIIELDENKYIRRGLWIYKEKRKEEERKQKVENKKKRRIELIIISPEKIYDEPFYV